MFVDCARNIGAVPILMTEGSLIKEDNRNKEEWRLRHVDLYVPYDFSYIAIEEADKIIRSVAKEKNVYFIDAKKLLIEKNNILFIDHVHLEDEGSKELATIVKNELKKLILSTNAPADNK